MTHRCSHCDLEFEHDPKKSDVVRCPKCLRAQGLEHLQDEDGKGRQKKAPEDSARWRPHRLILGAIAVATVVAAWFVLSGPDVEDLPQAVPARPLQVEEAAEYLRRESIKTDMAAFFEAPSSFEGGSTAKSVQAYVAARKKAGAFATWARVRATGDDVRTPPAVAQALGNKDKVKLYPLEVAWMAVVWLRDQGVPAGLAEIVSLEGEKAPPDPSGRLGYYGVATSMADDAEVVDVYGGAKKVKSARRLNDMQAIAAILSLQAMTAFETGDSQKASRLAQSALDLDGKSPVVRSAYSEALLSGVAQDAIKEIEHAHNLRPDAPRRLARAKVALAQGQLDQADKIIATLIAEYPDYASAHAMLSVIHLARHELDEAANRLDRAAKLAPDFPELDLFRAEISAARGDLSRAAEFARSALREKHVRWQTRLRAAMLLRAAGDYDEMRRQAHAIIEAVPEQQRALIRAQVEQLLGPTALEDPDALAADTSEEGSADLQLPGSSLLGADDDLDVSLLDDELSTDLQLDMGQGAAGGGLRLGGGGGSGPKLKLD